MDELSDIQDMLLNDLLRDYISQQESLKMISKVCTDKKVQRLLRTVISSQEKSADKILQHQKKEKERREPGA